MPIILIAIFAAALFGASFTEKKFGRTAAVGILVAAVVFCEIFVCNFSFFESRTFEDVNIAYSISNGTNQIAAPSDSIVIDNVNANVVNIYIESDAGYERARIFASDTGSESRYYAGEKYISKYSPQGSFIKTHFTGVTKSIRIYFPDIEDGSIAISSVKVNQKVPFCLSLLRIVMFICLLLFVYFIIIKREAFKAMCDFSKTDVRNIVISTAIICALVFTVIASLNPSFVSPNWTHHKQYALLAESFTEGHLYLDRVAPDEFINMDNPFDRTARRALFEELNMPEPWDMAFYGGHFYVYFGVLPVLIFYLPYHIITGGAFPNFLGVILFGYLLIAAVFLLYAKVIKMYFKKTPLALYLLLSVGTVFSGGVVYLIKRPDFYSIPLMGGVAFCVMGLYFWLGSKQNAQLDRVKLCIGSVFMACVLALRPNLIVFSCIAFVIFLNSVFKDRELLSIDSAVSKEKYRGLKNTIAFCLPYVIVAVGVMIYNALRFSSPFDFGAAYNLTTSDMVNRSFEIDRWGVGIFEYLFRFPTITALFPFLQENALETSYIGVTSHEAMYGGIFAVCPLLWSYAALCKQKKSPIFPISVFCGVIGVVICLIDIQAGGILPRYSADFSLFLVLGAALILFSLYELHPELTRKFAAYSLIAISIYAFSLVFVMGSSTISATNTGFFANVAAQISFFL